MQSRTGRSLSPVQILAAIALMLAGSIRPVQAQTDLPPAGDLVKRHVAAVNAALLIERGAVRTTGTFEMAAMGTTGELEVVQAQPNRMVVRMTLAGLGVIASGFDGEVGWSMNPMEGPRVMTGPELIQVRDESDFGANIRDPRLIESLETVELTEVEGKSCYKVRVIWKSGRESFDCYDAESGLMIATMLTSQTAMGPVDAVILFEDYRDFDGVRMPAVTIQQVFGQRLVTRVTSVSFDDIDSTAFALPPEIRALVGK